MSRFASTWDRGLRISTWIVAAVLVAVPAALLVFLLDESGEIPLPVGLAVVAAAIILPGAWALAPRGFAVEGRVLQVERFLFPVRIGLDEIRAVAVLPADVLKGALRVAGTSGLFGHYGRFWSRRLGSFRMYATRCKGLVLVDTAKARYLLSPDEPDRFAEALVQRAPRAARVDGALPPGSPGRPWVVPVAVVSVVLVVIGALLLGTVAFAPASIRVEGSFIRIERRWVGPISVPLSSVRKAGSLPKGAFGLVRTSGVAGLGQVAYGDYRSASLGRFRLYACKRGPFVLVDTVEERFVLTPDEPERFLAEVKAGSGAE
jgi:hypothetical protein